MQTQQQPAPALKQVRESKGGTKAPVHVADTDVVRIVTCRLEDVDVQLIHTNKENQLGPETSSVEHDSTEDGIAAIEARKKQPRLLPCPGVDFEHLESDNGLTDMHFNIEFKKPLGGCDIVRMAMNGGVLESPMPAAPTLQAGDEFIRDNLVLEVSAVENGTVKCVRGGHESDGAAFELGTVEATNLVHAYLQQQ